MRFTSVLLLAGAATLGSSATALAQAQMPDLVVTKPTGQIRIQAHVPGKLSMDVATLITGGRIEVQQAFTMLLRRFTLTRMSLHFANVVISPSDSTLNTPVPLESIGLHLRDAVSWDSTKSDTGAYPITILPEPEAQRIFYGDPTFVGAAAVNESYFQNDPAFDERSFASERRVTETITGSIDTQAGTFLMTAVVKGAIPVDWWFDGDYTITLTVSGCITMTQCEVVK